MNWIYGKTQAGKIVLGITRKEYNEIKAGLQKGVGVVTASKWSILFHIATRYNTIQRPDGSEVQCIDYDMWKAEEDFLFIINQMQKEGEL